jgi:hypothetical protein
VLTHIRDRHVFFLLLVQFCMFSVQYSRTTACSKFLVPWCLIITSFAPNSAIFARVLVVSRFCLVC